MTSHDVFVLLDATILIIAAVSLLWLLADQRRRRVRWQLVNAARQVRAGEDLAWQWGRELDAQVAKAIIDAREDAERFERLKDLFGVEEPARLEVVR